MSKFSVPPHYGELLLQPHENLSKTAGNPSPDPHHPPSSLTLTLREKPTLFLPPILSRLPLSCIPPSNLEAKKMPSTDAHLPDIDSVSLSLHRALHHFRPLDEHYASKDYQFAFNWDEVASYLPRDEEREWYVVAFRSHRLEGSQGPPLYDADREAHEEAVKQGGLIMYWYGVPHPVTGINLATCIWQSRKHAIAARNGPKHQKAASLAPRSFARWNLERWVLEKVKGGGLRFRKYEGGEVGW